jgi:hypothetical protein
MPDVGHLGRENERRRVRLERGRLDNCAIRLQKPYGIADKHGQIIHTLELAASNIGKHMWSHPYRQ